MRFAYQTQIGTSVFIIAGLVTLFTILVTVFSQSVRIASVNLGKSLQYEYWKKWQGATIVQA